MLWDNKNVNPEWSLDFSINKSSINFFKSKINEGNLEMGISSLIIENLGRRNVAISKINLNLTIKKKVI
ncbi:MAG: hypothetical protein IPM96_15745 [Ignavibacteria bacterium]|nr:hypothetical protein [Ignavibacteria bacterium]